MDVRNRKSNSVSGNNGLPEDIRPAWHPKLPKLLNRRKVVPKENKEEARNLSAAFSEHTWDLEKIVENYPNSRINLKNLQLSQGLSVSQAKSLLAENGPNALPKPKEISDFRLFLKQFLNLLWILMLVTDFFALVLFVYNPADTSQLWVTIIIFVMIFLMCCISFKNEREAKAIVRGFQNLLPENSVCIRDGKELTLSSEELVVGDIIWIKNGTKVPADARVLYCSQLKLETSSITGEAEPIEYEYEPTTESTTIFEAHNVAFNGSLCVDGEGIAVVIRTGTNTVIGQIADMTTGQDEIRSRLEVQIRKFVVFLIIAAGILGTTIFIIGCIVHNWTNVVFIMCQSYLVCAICLVPTGMPATVTSMIALVAKRLSERHVFIKRLDIVETLGSVNIIASDKTGTLTKNVMTVTDAWFLDEFIHGFPEKEKTIMTNKIKNPSIPFESPTSDILEIMTVCNSSKFLQEEDFLHTTIRRPKFDINIEMEKEKMNELRVTTGTPSEVAMLKYADQVIDVAAVRKSYNIIFEIPFNSKRKWHLMIAKLRNLPDGNAEYKLFIKGASEILVRKCHKIMTRNGIVELNEDCMNKFQAAYEVFGSNGRRVIGFAYKIFTAPTNITFDMEKENFPMNELEFAGICAIMDPPRDESAAAVESCRTAGIKVFMVTGDHYLTASAIAREIGLIVDIPGQERDYEIVHGEKISMLSEQEWDDLLKKRALVFARTTPEQKLLIVEKCQKRKLIIAMTGDGVNDAPALKKADIGIAMGSGSDVAKQAADIVLMNDNFASIVAAVQEGRIMFENIKKLLSYVTIHATPELWGVIINFFFGFPMGISSLQIFSIDLGTEIAPGIAFAKEPMEGDLMHRPPRRRDKILSSKTLLFYSYGYAGLIQSFGAFVGYCIVFLTYGIHLPDLFMTSMTYWQENAPDFTSNNHTFTWQEQMYINRQACSAWFVGIVVGQLFQILNGRTRRISIFKHGIFACPQSILGMFIAVVLASFMTYTPGVNTWFGGAPIGILPILGSAAVGVFMFTFNEIRKYFIRNYPKNNAVRLFKW